MDKIGIILVNYNAYQDTLECIESLGKMTYLNYEIIVVDNFSSDNSLSQLKQIKNIHLIEAKQNGGFAYGNNLGIHYALKHGCNQVLLLNNDTTVEPDFLEKMIKTSQNQNIGIVAPKILNYYDRHIIWSAGGTINWRLFVGYNDQTGMIDSKIKEVKDVEFSNGCCLLIKKEVIETIGDLPEDYFMYYEDLDYCLQVRKNYRIIYNSEAVIYHKVSASSGIESPFQLEWVTRSQLKFMNKYQHYVDYKTLKKCKVEIYLRKYARILSYLFKFDYTRAHAILKGMDQKKLSPHQ